MSTLPLYHLQQIDSRMESIENELSLLLEPLAEEKEFQEVSYSYERVEKKRKEAERLQKAAEMELSSIESEKKTVEKKLYSGKVTNSKELLQLEKEIQQIQKKRDVMDEKILKGMETLEQLEKESSFKKKEMEAAKASLEIAQKNREGEKTNLVQALDELKRKRENQLQAINLEWIDLYLSLKDKKDGVAVAKVENQACGGCFMEVPGTLIQKARSLEMVTCSSCGRILVM
ncbi:MAG: C4-type zinc ribbon domain-containing protein [Firmicutes bacterium]|nr:C4-type zinc ribbon domain-containing protein [Bacillota bacterium]